MLFRCVLLFVFLSCVRSRDSHRDVDVGNTDSDFNDRFSIWPSMHNGATVLRFRRQLQAAGLQTDNQGSSAVLVPSEGGGVNVPKHILPTNEHDQNNAQPMSDQTPVQKQQPPETANSNNNNTASKNPPLPAKVANVALNDTKELPGLSNQTPKGKEVPESQPSPSAVIPHSNVTTTNSTNVEKAKQLDLSNPAAMMRGLIVFGGFALMAMCYFICYRTKGKYNETNNSNGTSESNQFRYGVLQSDDRRDNLELSSVPLTMESDDEEDEDLEIFDLEQKKKSLSYVNLQANDEDIVLSPRIENERDNLLLDIEDSNSDVLINWSNNGSKSIL